MEVDSELGQMVHSSQKDALNPLMQVVGKTLLCEVTKQYKEKEEMSDDLLLALHSVFGNSFEKALDLLDSTSSSVVFLRSPRKRSRVTCKHVLVAYLCQLMEKGRQVDISNEELTKILCSAAHICDGRTASNV